MEYDVFFDGAADRDAFSPQERKEAVGHVVEKRVDVEGFGAGGLFAFFDGGERKHAVDEAVQAVGFGLDVFQESCALFRGHLFVE